MERTNSLTLFALFRKKLIVSKAMPLHKITEFTQSGSALLQT
jgi:hypothetical protein